MKSAFITAIALCASWAYAQTVTTTDAAGNSIVEVVTQIPPGIPTTEILETIIAPTLTTTTPSTTNTILQTTTSTTKQQGPVGQPAQTTNLTPGGPTPYTYTTTNAAGETTALVGTFTPTGPATVLPDPTTTGVIMNFSSYVASYGSVAATASGGRQAFSLSSGWHGVAVSMALGIGGGVWFVLL
ncbi:hypothetical protein AZE42_06875 [Rhizopogon vesiculosus]|uniref:Uncharacterized protein n=1 Tax=Rhizopogon vesiculosus TaxID=180088 RepID=A0A1J8QSQ8_9AGAM|nr:hypothetical protein AZE42_06875 [Rhizopogon vesiculosus]